MQHRTLSGLLVIATLAGCAKAPPPPPPPDAAAIKTAIAAELNKLIPASQKKDAAALAALFTDDATWIANDASASVGRAALEKRLASIYATVDSMRVSSYNINRLIVVSDSEAVTFSTGNYTMYAKGKKPFIGVNPFADHWKKGADGVWRIAYEVNADGPAPVPAVPPAKK